MGDGGAAVRSKFFIKNERVSSTRVNRSWGHYHVITKGPGYQVKQLFVQQWQSTSMQRHKFRDEWYMRLDGRGIVVTPEKVSVIPWDDFFVVKKGEWHQIVNLHQYPCIIAEVQFGTRIDENDIERRDDE